jgi:hypothetical protein
MYIRILSAKSVDNDESYGPLLQMFYNNSKIPEMNTKVYFLGFGIIFSPVFDQIEILLRRAKKKFHVLGKCILPCKYWSKGELK